MNQQINLYQPIFREERKLFSLNTVLSGWVVIALSLSGMWVLGERNVAALQKAVDGLKAQQAAQEQMAQAAGVLLDAQGSPAAVQAQVQVLSAQLADRTNALTLLQNGAAGQPRGFATRLQALARQHTEGVWLDQVLLAGGPHGLALRGRSVDPESVPKYLQQLASEPELSGARFDEVIIDRRKHHDTKSAPPAALAKDKDEDSPTVRFSISSQGLSLLEEQGS